MGTNVSSLSAQRFLGITQLALTKNLSHLASGSRITAAGDDAAGLGISEELKSQIVSTAQAERNSNDALSLGQTADGALSAIGGILGRLRELAVQAANGTLDTNSRSYINSEFKSLSSEIDRIANVTDFNGLKLLDGSLSSGVSLQVGINNTANDTINIALHDSRTSAIGSGGLVSNTTVDTAATDTLTNSQNAIATIDHAIWQISNRRADVGTTENRLSATQLNLQALRENLAAANSRIRDVDVAYETAELTRNQVLSQAGEAALSQANQFPSAALSLLGGR